MIPQQTTDMNAEVQRVVLAGMKIMYAKETADLLEQTMSNKQPMPQRLAMEIGGLMKLVDERTQKGIAPDAIAPASIMLLFDLAKFIKQSGRGNPTEKDIKQAMILLGPMLKEIFGKHGKGANPPAPPQGQPQPEQPQAQAMPPQQPTGLIGSAMGA